jgi:secreted PhoX family phosphatase
LSDGARWGQGRFTRREGDGLPSADRRRFLAAAGAAAAWPALESVLAPLASASAPPSPFASFRPIEPSDRDDIVLPEGFRFDVVIKWGDPFTASGETFGYNNDWIGAFELAGAEEALLTINQEYISVAFLGDVALYPETFKLLRGREATIDDFKRDVGSPCCACAATGPPGPGCRC